METVAAGIGSGSLLRSLHWRAIQAWHAVSSMETRQGASTMPLLTATEAVWKDFRAAKGDEQHGTVTCGSPPLSRGKFTRGGAPDRAGKLPRRLIRSTLAGDGDPLMTACVQAPAKIRTIIG